FYMEKKFYFAYGSNMDEEVMKWRGVNYTDRFFGKLENYKLVFQEFYKKEKLDGVFANIIPQKGSYVEGIIYECDESVERLDKQEDYPVEYLKEELNIDSERGPIECLVYVGNPESVRDEEAPKKKYLSHLLNGKDLLSEDYYKKLLETETAS
ncbi:MAG: gamma-glutamylcyclotransferase family protein, partial [Candidatus Paceibacterota bacterium]